MDAVMLLEKLFGFWFLVIGVSLFTANREWKKLLTFWMKNPEQLKCFALMMFPLGLITVLLHNVWSGWSIIVTILGWLMTLKMATIMCFPTLFYKVTQSVVQNKKVFIVGGILYVVIAALVLAGAFM